VSVPDERGDIHAGRTGAYDPRTLGPWLAVLAALAAAAIVNALAARP
jgi:hypothetical protein